MNRDDVALEHILQRIRCMPYVSDSQKGAAIALIRSGDDPDEVLSNLEQISKDGVDATIDTRLRERDAHRRHVRRDKK